MLNYEKKAEIRQKTRHKGKKRTENARKFSDFKANVAAKFGRFRKSAYICTRFWSEEREKAHSSIG